MLPPRSLLLLVAHLLLVICVTGRAQSDGQDVSDTQAKRIQDLKYILDQLNPARLLNGQLALDQSDTPILPGKSQKRPLLRKRQNGTDVSSVDSTPTTTPDQATTTTIPGTTAEPPPPSTTAAPPSSSQGETGDVPTTPAAPTTPSQPAPPTQQPGPTQEPGPTQAPGPTTSAAPPAGDSTTPLPPVVLPPSSSPAGGGSGNTGGSGSTGGAPAPPPSSIDVPVTTTDGQGNTIVSTTRAPAPPSGTSGGSAVTPTPDAPASFTGEINVVTTDQDGEPITLSSVSFGEVITTTGRNGRTFVTTFTPAGGRVSSIVLQTTTLPNGQRSTITSYAPVAQATNGSPSGGSVSSTADASLVSSAFAAPTMIAGGRFAAVAGGLFGLAQLL
ncbi:hypothetical protein BDZ85DRAFT_266537 [Elsinoe ampelina]|uniref:Uncharacterized protein n=1 Tax=Elsinoe ampelina TaxID=302913 RepID=A0A6A6G3S9_9PEZI|nr:hypothetical protein BDZ85DRAFT_266537 [Elsinoe ampelina]